MDAQHQDYSRRSHEQVVRDLNEAHDRVKFLLGDSDRKDILIMGLERSIERQKLMLWIQGAALTGCWGLLLRMMFR